jgi:hypothetical protein
VCLDRHGRIRGDSNAIRAVNQVNPMYHALVALDACIESHQGRGSPGRRCCAVIAGIAFVVHPSAWRAKFASVAPLSRPLFALVAVAAVPLVVYAVGQVGIHTSSGPHDEHYEFWVVMAVYALLMLLFGAVAAWRVSGWRFPLWAAGLMSIALGIGSLGIAAVSHLSTVWSLLAITWGVAFIVLGEREARTHVAAVRTAATSPVGDR